MLLTTRVLPECTSTTFACRVTALAETEQQNKAATKRRLFWIRIMMFLGRVKWDCGPSDRNGRRLCNGSDCEFLGQHELGFSQLISTTTNVSFRRKSQNRKVVFAEETHH